MILDGFVNLLKPPGMTSFDAVAQIKRILKVKKVGHTGTLDPGVAGVLPICVGKATRLAEYITDRPKAYRAEITLGVTTDTQDAYGQIIDQKSAVNITFDDFQAVLNSFAGEIEQIPPMTSAVHVQGKRLYELARQGIEVERKPRKAFIYEVKIHQAYFDGKHPRIIFDILCSKGTYIRTICHDIGQRLGVGAFMSYLIRTRSGPFHLENALTIEEIKARTAENDFSFIHSLAAGISFMPNITLNEQQVQDVYHGKTISIPYTSEIDEFLCHAIDDDHQLLAVGTLKKQSESIYTFKPGKVLSH